MSHTPKSKMLREPLLVRDPSSPKLALVCRRPRSLTVLGGRALVAALMAMLLVGSAETPPPPEDPPAVPDLGPVDHRAAACPAPTPGTAWAGPSGDHLSTRVTLTVRYPEHPGSVRREATSWGGVIALDLKEGANILDIARATGTRVGTGVPLHEGRGAPRLVPRSAGQQGEGVQALPDVLVADAYVQAPPHVTVAEAAELLLARDDVLAAHPLMFGDPGTEGCSEHAPCNPGQSCCYVCGIAGCPNICYDGSCPRNVP